MTESITAREILSSPNPIAELINALTDEFTGIIGFAELIHETDIFRRERSDEIMLCAERTLGVLRAVADDHRFQQDRRECELNRLLVDLEPSLAVVAGPNVRLSQELDPRVGQIPISDADVMMVCISLIGAARNGMSKEGGRITIRTIVSEGNGPSRKVARLLIEDDGGGLDPSDPRVELSEGMKLELNHPFGRLASVVDRADGRIELRSGAGVWTTIQVQFPTN